MIDTHTHLYLSEFGAPDEQRAVVARAIEAGVDKMIFPNVDLATIAPMRALAAEFPSNIKMAMGLHPTEVGPGWRDALATVEAEHLSHETDYIAVGEVGIDLYWDKTYADEQMQAFDAQVSLAARLGIPVIIHCREGLDQALEVMQGHKGVPAVFHSFGGTAQDVDRIRSVGDYYFGINGIVTFKNSTLRNVLPEITASRILLETDAPYLAPVPHRGRRNESSYLPATAAHIAQTLTLPLSALTATTTASAHTLFPRLN